MNRFVYVFYNDTLAGILSEDNEGYVFHYDDAYFENKNNKPISLLFPLNQQEYRNKVLFPFFDGLIPEGYLLEIAIKKMKIDYRDRFKLLSETCEDPIGAVSIRKELK